MIHISFSADPAHRKAGSKGSADGPGHIHTAGKTAHFHRRLHLGFSHDPADDDFSAIDEGDDVFFASHQHGHPAVAFTILDLPDPIVSVIVIVVMIVVIVSDAAEIRISSGTAFHTSRIPAMADGPAISGHDTGHQDRRTSRRNIIHGACAVADRPHILQRHRSGLPVPQIFMIHVDRAGESQILYRPFISVKQSGALFGLPVRNIDRMSVPVKGPRIIPLGGELERHPVQTGQIQILHEDVIRSAVPLHNGKEILLAVDPGEPGGHRGLLRHIFQQIQIVIFGLQLLGRHRSRRQDDH